MEIKHISEAIAESENPVIKEVLEKKKDEELEYAISKLLDIAEENYPKYYLCDTIAMIQDIYKKHFN